MEREGIVGYGKEGGVENRDLDEAEKPEDEKKDENYFDHVFIFASMTRKCKSCHIL